MKVIEITKMKMTVCVSTVRRAVYVSCAVIVRAACPGADREKSPLYSPFTQLCLPTTRDLTL